MKVFNPELQTTDEKVIYAFDLSARKPTGGTVNSAAGTIMKAGASAASLVTTPSVSGDTINATVEGGASKDLTSTGDWFLDVLVTLSNGEKVRGRVPIRVDA